MVYQRLDDKFAVCSSMRSVPCFIHTNQMLQLNDDSFQLYCAKRDKHDPLPVSQAACHAIGIESSEDGFLCRNCSKARPHVSR